MNVGYLALENGMTFPGNMPEWCSNKHVSGEVVFTTGMCGYSESLTDPSFSQQILVFTYPLIGNYGVFDQSLWESQKIHTVGVIVNESCSNWSHQTGIQSLEEWLKKENVFLLKDVDTRALTKILRKSGTLHGTLSNQKMFCQQERETQPVARVSINQKKIYGDGKKRIILVDCGLKENILRELLKYPIQIIRVPHDYDYTNDDYDGIFLSNGPGDPLECQATILILKKAMSKKKPIFGICLGAQMLALASGAKTYKLDFGHRGQNQPCYEIKSGRCYITSQNHGYAIEEKSLQDGWEVTLRNLNDQSVEGISHKEFPFHAVQFHPEASPGPTDTRFFFDRFYKCVNEQF